MDKPISVGDLVVIVRASHCGSTASIGSIFRVTVIRKRRWGSVCEACRHVLPEGEWVAELAGDDSITELHRLKRIPPLGELEGVKTEEDIREPA